MKRYFKIKQEASVTIYNLIDNKVSGVIYTNNTTGEDYYTTHKDWNPWGCLDNSLKEIITQCNIHGCKYSIIETNDIESEIFLECI